VATDVLLHVLLEQLSNSYGCQAHPEDILARVPAELGGVHSDSNRPGRVIVLGGSHAKRLAAELQKAGLDLIDLSSPGWTPTEENISHICSELTKLGDISTCTAICDMISNVVYRFEQFDGTLCLAVNLDGRWHMAGKVTVCPKETVRHMLTSLKPIFDLLPGLKICLPPLPRYLKTPCCNARGHCKDINTQQFSAELMGKSQTIRKTMRDHLHSTVSRVWVPDIYGQLFPDCKTSADLATSFANITGSDGVHLTLEGYGSLAVVVQQTLTEQISPSLSVSGSSRPGERPREYYWRGFVSPVGSERPVNSFAYHRNRNAGGGKWKSVPYAKSASRGFLPHRPSGGRKWN